jgi:hypothetical protein
MSRRASIMYRELAILFIMLAVAAAIVVPLLAVGLGVSP